MVEEILEAARALCLSPRRVRPKRAPSDLIIASMQRGIKRARRELVHPETSVRDSQSASKLAHLDSDRAGLAHDPIVISDSDDDILAADQDAVEAVLQHASKQEEDQDEEFSGALQLQSLAKRFVYHSPTKSRLVRKTDPESESSSTAELLRPSTSSTKLSPILKTGLSSSSKLPAETSLPASKKVKGTKGKARTTIQLRKTREAAEQASIAPLGLERVPSGGIRLILRCSFCAGLFAKSTSAAVKQEHLSLCAALQGIKRSAIAVETIVSDIQSALRREKEEEKKASDARTVLQDVMHNADIVQHEGRASQIATSPKKRGKDKVVIKKAIKRSTKPALLIAQDPLAGPSLAPRNAAHNLLPAKKAMQAARDTAIQLLGDAIFLKAELSKSDRARKDALKLEVNEQPSDVQSGADMPSTPVKTRKRILSEVHTAELGDDDDTLDTTRELPIISAEQVFASMASSSSPQKSPVKALQKSRERQLSREQDESLASEISWLSPGSPNLPQTPPFAPSKLAQRQRTRAGTAKEKLFGAQTTTRSLLDLVQDRQGDHRREISCESKRKAEKDDEALDGADKKRAKLSGLEPPDGNVMHEHNRIAPDAGISLDQDMDVDDQPDSSSQADVFSRSSMGKLQEGLCVTASSTSANGLAGTDETDEQAALSLQQTVMKRCTDQPQRADIVADRLDEDQDEGKPVEEADDDDDEDTQSFLDLLEPSEVIYDPVFSQTHSLSDPSSDEIDESDATETAHRTRRMLIACGGSSITTEYRRKGRDVPFPSSQKALAPTAARESSVSNSDPDLVLLTDDSCDDSSPENLISPSL